MPSPDTENMDPPPSESETPRQTTQPEQNTEEPIAETTAEEACGIRVTPYIDLDGKSFHFYTPKTLFFQTQQNPRQYQ